MASRQYRWLRSSGWSGDLSLARLMTAAAAHILVGRGPFTIVQDGQDDIGNDLTRSECLSRLRQAVSHREVGSTFRVRKRNGDIVFVCRAVRAPAYDADTTSGNEKADRFWNWVRLTYPQFRPRYAGAYVCKVVSGSSELSQHSYGNAVDVFFDTIAHQHVVYTDIKQGKCPVPVSLAICERHDWSPGSGESAYGGVYHGHLHAQFAPEQSGACGVKG